MNGASVLGLVCFLFVEIWCIYVVGWKKKYVSATYTIEVYHS